MTIFEKINSALQNGSRREVTSLCRAAIQEGIPADDILKQGLLPGMNQIAEQYRNNQIFVPHVIMVSSAMNAGTRFLQPYLVEKLPEVKGKVCFGTVRGDVHDIGKCLCVISARSRGLEVIDLGVNVSPAEFVQTAIREECDIIGCSALLTSTMKEMEKVVQCAEGARIRDRVKIMIGGAPVTQKFADQIGADCYTTDAIECADRALSICGQMNSR